MSEKSYLVTYKGTSVVELEGAGVFHAGVSAFVGAKAAEAARQDPSFRVEERSAAAPEHSTREELEAKLQAEQGGAAAAPAEKQPAPKKPEPTQQPEPAKPEPAKPEDKKADDKKDEDKKPEEAKKEEPAKPDAAK